MKRVSILCVLHLSPANHFNSHLMEFSFDFDKFPVSLSQLSYEQIHFYQHIIHSLNCPIAGSGVLFNFSHYFFIHFPSTYCCSSCRCFFALTLSFHFSHSLVLCTFSSFSSSSFPSFQFH